MPVRVFAWNIKNKNGIGSRFFREPGIGYAKTCGNSGAGNRGGEVPGAKQTEYGRVAKAYMEEAVGIT